MTREKVILKISDDQSGLKSYRGEIDGKFVLFELDGKTGRISYRLESNRVKKVASIRCTLWFTICVATSSLIRTLLCGK